jgi:stage II sporulation protein D
MRLKLVLILLIAGYLSASGQIRIRLFASSTPETVLFSVVSGKYEMQVYPGESKILDSGKLVVISKYQGRLAVKPRNMAGFVADSLIIIAQTDKSSFSLRNDGNSPVRQYYKGDFSCYPDLETLVMINNCDVDNYIAGVVRAEGGINRHKEYFKTQAIIARTYLYSHLDKHLHDNYNVCDNTHCQAFNGITPDSVINAASMETRGMVLLGADSVLIVSAFHSNCGGMTASSKDVWISDQPYLKSVVDPYCVNSKNATWEKKIGFDDWIAYLTKSGYSGKTNDMSLLSFFQNKRWVDYKAGTFTLPFEKIREDFKLRSSYFSVIAAKDSVTFRGKGYGHGVGLCQEGAMEMAAKGMLCKEIIDFYYFGVILTDIKNAKFLEVR